MTVIDVAINETDPATDVSEPEAAETPEAKPISAEITSEFIDTDWYHRLKEQREIVRRRQQVVDDLSEDLKDAKKSLDTANSELLEIIDEDEQPVLPFASNGSVIHQGKARPPSPVPADDESWRAVTLDGLGIYQPRLIETLTDAGLTSMGAICDYTNDNKRLIDLKGIGPGKVQFIENLIEKYWTEHPRQPVEIKAIEEADLAPKADPEIWPGAIGFFEFGVARSYFTSTYDPHVANSAIALKQPKVMTVLLADDRNRLVAGDYIAVGLEGDGLIMLPVYEREKWLAEVGRYERETHSDPPGVLAGTVVVRDDGAQLQIGGDDRRAVIDLSTRTVDRKFLAIPDVDLEVSCHPTIGALAAYDPDQPIAEIHHSILVYGEPYLVLPSLGDRCEGIYELRRLIPEDRAEYKSAVEADPLANRIVRLGGDLFRIGAGEDALHVRS